MDKRKSLLLLTAAAAGSVIYNIWKPVKSKLPVIENFELEKYLGKWYEIARLDFFWEKNLRNVTAEYTLSDDNTIKVVNKGINIHSGVEKTKTGKAKFQSTPNRGDLKVSFFGPFYAGYHIMHIDKDYQYALVFGDTLDNMWILSRAKNIPDDVKVKYLDYARQSGYNTSDLVWTAH